MVLFDDNTVVLKEVLKGLFSFLLFSCLLFFMEWLFFYTKPSFMTILTLKESFLALFVGGGLFFFQYFGGVLAYFLLCILLAKNSRFSSEISLFSALPSAVVLMVLTMLLLDNFTTTTIRFGIAKTIGIERYFYLLLFLSVLSYFTKQVSVFLAGVELRRITILSSIVFVPFPLVSGTVYGLELASAFSNSVTAKQSSVQLNEEKPNIIFFASDGIDAAMMSAYGNKNLTTPYLDSLLLDSLVFENAFSNSAQTTGSTTSMLTGKHPLTTKVLFPPHILQPQDSTLHLPAILKSNGYTLMQESVRYYADAFDLNFVNGFDVSNGRESYGYLFSDYLQSAEILKIKIQERIYSRLAHLLFVEDMVDVYSLVAEKKDGRVLGGRDEARILRIMDFIQEVDQPFFIHTHLMDTHCCDLTRPKIDFPRDGESTEKQIAILKAEQEKKIQLVDFLKASDQYLSQIVEVLKESGKYQNTIIVYSSDHNNGWGVEKQIPLIFILPGFDVEGRVIENAQLLDVAPTVLDLIGVSPPKWMEGQSLLRDIEASRSIYSIKKIDTETFKAKENENLVRIFNSGFPGFGLQRLAALQCDHWYILDVGDNTLEIKDVDRHSSLCSDKERKSPEVMKKEILQFIKSKNVFER